MPEPPRAAPSRSTPVADDVFEEFYEGTDGRKASTTMAFVRLLSKLLRDKEIGKLRRADRSRRIAHVRHGGAVPPGRHLLARRPALRAGRHRHAALLQGSEGRPDSRRRHHRSRLDVVVHRRRHRLRDARREHDSLLHLLFDVRLPADRRPDLGRRRQPHAAGFLLGGTAGRTTLNGEGLQHQDGHSHVLAHAGAELSQPTTRPLPTRLAVIIQDGIRRMYENDESIFYYLTRDERELRDAGDAGRRRGRHPQGACTSSARRGLPKAKARAQLFGSGAILREVLKAQEILEAKYGVGADVWSVTSYNELHRDGHACERWNLLHPGEPPRVPYVTQCLKDAPGVFVAASDYMKVLPDSIDRWVPRPLVALGTDGFGRSENRASLRDFFEVDAPLRRGRHAVGAGARQEDRREGRADAIEDLQHQPGEGQPGHLVQIRTREPELHLATDFRSPNSARTVAGGDVLRVLVKRRRHPRERAAGPRARNRQGRRSRCHRRSPARSPTSR